MFFFRTLVLALILNVGFSTLAIAQSLETTLQAIIAEIAAHESAANAPPDSTPSVAARQVKAENAKTNLEAHIARDKTALEAARVNIVEHVTHLTNGVVPTPTPDEVKPPSPSLLTPKHDPASGMGSSTGVADPGFFNLDGLGKPLAGDVAGMKRRILTRPDAVLRVDKGSETPLTTFSILYVYKDQTGTTGVRWLAVGARADRVDGWVRHNMTEDWKHMLVMEYTPRTKARKPVLFFSSKEQLKKVIEDPLGQVQAEEIYKSVAKKDNASGRIVTVEPSRSVGRNKTYLMPILDHDDGVFGYGDYADVKLLQLAGLTGESSSRDTPDTPIGTYENTPRTKELKNFRIGIAFVIDTTRSMGPYINATKDFVRNVYAGLEKRGLVDRFRFGLIGFRDNVEAAPGAGYVTNIYSDLNKPRSMGEFFSKIDAVLPSMAPTEDWREDAFAGLRSAVYDLDWSDVDARFIILVTDASARPETDTMAAHRSFGAASVRAIVDQHDITVYSVHLRTEEARRAAGDAEIIRAETQYKTLGSYLPVGGDTARVFGRALEGVENKLVEALISFSEGRELDDGVDAAVDYQKIDVMSGRKVLIDPSEAKKYAEVWMGDGLFPFQQDFLGDHEGVKPPKFYRAWAADHDLLMQNQESLSVSVLVSRGQLELLADALARIIDDIVSKKIDLTEGFVKTRGNTGVTHGDPKLELPTTIAQFLEALPYKSKFLQLSKEGFLGLGQGQEDLLNEVGAKLTGYREILSSDKRWMRVSDTSEEELYPLPLRDLP